LKESFGSCSPTFHRYLTFTVLFEIVLSTHRAFAASELKLLRKGI